MRVVPTAQPYLTQSVFKVGWQKATPTQIRQLILYIGNLSFILAMSKGNVGRFVGELPSAKRLEKHVVRDTNASAVPGDTILRGAFQVSPEPCATPPQDRVPMVSFLIRSARAEDAQGTPTQSRMSPSILQHSKKIRQETTTLDPFQREAQPPGSLLARDPGSDMKRELHWKLSGNEVHHPTSSILLVNNMLCSKLHARKS